MSIDTEVALYAKIAGVINSIGNLQNDKTMAFNGVFQYNYLSFEKTLEAVKRELLKHKLLIFPMEFELLPISTFNNVSLKAKWMIVDTENKNKLYVQSMGQGQDKGDKAMGKAQTNALKYLFFSTFEIGRGDDPDHYSSEVTSREVEQVQAEVGRITPDQHARLKAKFEELGITKRNADKVDKVKMYLINMGIAKTEELPQDKYDSFLAWLRAEFELSK